MLFFNNKKISRFGFRANNGTAESVERNDKKENPQ